MPELLALHPLDRAYLDVLTDDVAIMQHAIGSQPDPAHGYCTDDVARALRVDLLHRRTLGWDAVAASVTRNMRFLDEAFDRSTGRFRNFRAIGGRWDDEIGSEDCHGRALLILGEMIDQAPDDALVTKATFLFQRGLPAAMRLTALRAQSSAFLGCDAAMRGSPNGTTSSACRNLGAKLQTAFLETPGMTAEWPWPEASLTYENALLARAAIAAGRYLDDHELVAAGLRGLDWLLEVQTNAAGQLSPIGSTWWPRDGVRAQFDQQPIEPTSLLLAAKAAYRATRDTKYRDAMERAYGWFLGQNDLGVPVADPEHGACFDGLTPDGVNVNQGAESTLMWLTALEHIRDVRGTVGGASAAAPSEATLSAVAS
jgi:hypothetical protein